MAQFYQKYPMVIGGAIGAGIMLGLIAIFVALFAASSFRVSQQTRMYQAAAEAQKVVYRTCVTVGAAVWCTDSNEAPRPLSPADLVPETAATTP